MKEKYLENLTNLDLLERFPLFKKTLAIFDSCGLLFPRERHVN